MLYYFRMRSPERKRLIFIALAGIASGCGGFMAVPLRDRPAPLMPTAAARIKYVSRRCVWRKKSCVRPPTRWGSVPPTSCALGVNARLIPTNGASARQGKAALMAHASLSTTLTAAGRGLPRPFVSRAWRASERSASSSTKTRNARRHGLWGCARLAQAASPASAFRP